MKTILHCTFLICILNCVATMNIRSPSVFVVTPAPRVNDNEARSAPFFYHDWMRRMDPPQNSTTTTTTTSKTPDLIFAEFESNSGNNIQKSIRQLLEKEKVKQMTMSPSPSTTPQPIHIPDNKAVQDSTKTKNPMDYIAMYNSLYNDSPSPTYFPSTTTRKITTTTTTAPPHQDIANIWHTIDSEKSEQLSGNWEELPIDTKDETNLKDVKLKDHFDAVQNSNTEEPVNEDFALSRFNTNPGNGAENESRAIRTEPKIRFPYVSLKPFQMTKNTMNPSLQVLENSKKSNNMFTNLDNFKEINSPVRGEAQDVAYMRPPIERYNPAQPYLPPDNGSNRPKKVPTKSVSNLVPPPPPPPPKVTGDDFPAPPTYESFPPYLNSVKPSTSISKPPNPPVDAIPQFQDDDDGLKLGYQYKPPIFLPTVSPISKPASNNGYSYSKPTMTDDSPPASSNGYSYSKPTMTGDSPPVSSNGYSYNKPSMTYDFPPASSNSYSYNKPSMTDDSPPEMEMGDTKPSPASDEDPTFHGYHYDKPTDSDHHHSYSYDHHTLPFNGDYPELIFDKPPKGMEDNKGGNDNDMGMMPPPPPADMMPEMDSDPPMHDHDHDHGFPSDFPHDFDDFFHHHHHHHHTTTTTTTTTTESPRVNRYSYYYIGKKLYYLPLYFSVYFIVYVGYLITRAILRHKIVYPNSWRPNDTTSTFFSKRSVDSFNLSNENLHELTGRITKAVAEAAEKYVNDKSTKDN